MSTDRLARLLYAGAIGGLCAIAFDGIVMSLLAGLSIILVVCMIAEIYGEK